MSKYKIKLSSDINNLDKNIKIIIVRSVFNDALGQKLEDENIKFLIKNGFENIDLYYVPGAFEIPSFVNRILENIDKQKVLVITLGIVIRGETSHYDIVANETAREIMRLSCKFYSPIIFGVLTCENEEQVLARIDPSASISGLNLFLELNKINY